LQRARVVVERIDQLLLARDARARLDLEILVRVRVWVRVRVRVRVRARVTFSTALILRSISPLKISSAFSRDFIVWMKSSFIRMIAASRAAPAQPKAGASAASQARGSSCRGGGGG
jgi:hypothetical protein